jgi:opacity protein-like surface antigen
MRFAFVLTAALALALAVVVFAADVAGTWKGTLETPMGPMENTIVLAADGASLTGSVKTDFFEAKLDNGKLDGDKVSFEINIEFGKLVYEGTVAGDDLKLNVTGPDGSKIPLNAKRQK